MSTNAANVESFLRANSALCESVDVQRVQSQLETLLSKHKEVRRFALVTNGGTTVPLEKNAVRFIANFSTGGRGRRMCERLLEAGYCVILLLKCGAQEPFQPDASMSNLVSRMHLNKDGAVVVSPSDDVECAIRLREKTGSSLCSVYFNNVVEYLFLLRVICNEMRLKSIAKPLVVLAAAVSDFYIPYASMTEHKLSTGDALTLTLQPVPKALEVIQREWLRGLSPFMVSFKLETNEQSLMDKVKRNMDRYSLDLVVANLLQSYNQVVWLITKDEKKEIRVAPAGGDVLETPLVASLMEKHEAW